MHIFWAEFQTVGNDIFRLDTRIYLEPIGSPEVDDVCIGAVVGKNPGSAKSDQLNSGIMPLSLDGDKLLPTVRNMILKAYENGTVTIPSRGYIQILNLFYLCDPDLQKGLNSVKNHNNPKLCTKESNQFPWVWYVWGGENKTLNQFKQRFQKMDTPHHFYFDPQRIKIIESVPSENDFAKHTQGLKHEYVIPFLSLLLKKI